VALPANLCRSACSWNEPLGGRRGAPLPFTTYGKTCSGGTRQRALNGSHRSSACSTLVSPATSLRAAGSVDLGSHRLAEARCSVGPFCSRDRPGRHCGPMRDNGVLRTWTLRVVACGAEMESPGGRAGTSSRTESIQQSGRRANRMVTGPCRGGQRCIGCRPFDPMDARM
jgi:hypothetical protein